MTDEQTPEPNRPVSLLAMWPSQEEHFFLIVENLGSEKLSGFTKDTQHGQDLTLICLTPKCRLSSAPPSRRGLGATSHGLISPNNIERREISIQ